MTFEEKVEQIKQKILKNEDITNDLSDLYWSGIVAGGNDVNTWAVCYNYMRINPSLYVEHRTLPTSFGARASGTNES